MLEKFIQETNLMKKFCHPNIVSLLGRSPIIKKLVLACYGYKEGLIIVCIQHDYTLAGVSSHDVNEDSAPLMILEYMPYGDLHGFLVKNRCSVECMYIFLGVYCHLSCNHNTDPSPLSHQ